MQLSGGCGEPEKRMLCEQSLMLGEGILKGKGNFLFLLCFE